MSSWGVCSHLCRQEGKGLLLSLPLWEGSPWTCGVRAILCAVCAPSSSAQVGSLQQLARKSSDGDDDEEEL